MSHDPDRPDLRRLATLQRAERVADARIDAARGEPPLSDDDAAWLDAQRARDPNVASAVARRERAVELLRRTPRPVAPGGFGDRVLHAISESAPPGRSRISAGVLALAAAAALFALYVYVDRPPPRADGVVVSGTGVPAGALTADFRVRPSGLGPAAVRARLSAIVTAHHGTIFSAGGGLDVRLPRDALVAVLQDLARQGRFRIEKVSRDALPADRQFVVLHVELE